MVDITKKQISKHVNIFNKELTAWNKSAKQLLFYHNIKKYKNLGQKSD